MRNHRKLSRSKLPFGLVWKCLIILNLLLEVITKLLELIRSLK